MRAKSLGLKTTGETTPIIPVITGKEEVGRFANVIGLQKGLIATVLEFPVVGLGKSRFRISMTPHHTKEQMDTALQIIKESITEAEAFAKELDR